MFYAINKDGLRIGAYEADDNDEYMCPVCNNHVILKRGSVNIAHFAHEAHKCEDNWNYDMSEWHKRMQNNFPKDSQEVVVSHRGRKHRADVLMNNIVLEFQYSPITADEFNDRNEFFLNAGYRLAWIFNLSQISDDNLYMSDEKNNMMIWKHPMRIFSNSDYLSEYNNRFALWFSFHGDNEFEETGEEYIERVVWAIRDEDGIYSLNRFFTSNHVIVLDGKTVINPNHFFYSRMDFFKEKILELKSKYSFSVKYNGKKGESKESYICPRRNGKFGIVMWGEEGCCYCRYCYMAAQTQKENRKMFASYCCYPTAVRELCEIHPGYECPQVDIFEI